MKHVDVIERLQRIRQFYRDTIEDYTAVEAVDMAISALEFKERYDRFWEEVKSAGKSGKETEIRHSGKDIESIEPADVVQVVRCDDYVYYGSRRWCELHSSVFDDNAFCSYGERKE